MINWKSAATIGVMVLVLPEVAWVVIGVIAVAKLLDEEEVPAAS